MVSDDPRSAVSDPTSQLGCGFAELFDCPSRRALVEWAIEVTNERQGVSPSAGKYSIVEEYRKYSVTQLVDETGISKSTLKPSLPVFHRFGIFEKTDEENPRYRPTVGEDTAVRRLRDFDARLVERYSLSKEPFEPHGSLTERANSLLEQSLLISDLFKTHNRRGLVAYFCHEVEKHHSDVSDNEMGWSTVADLKRGAGLPRSRLNDHLPALDQLGIVCHRPEEKTYRPPVGCPSPLVDLMKFDSRFTPSTT